MKKKKLPIYAQTIKTIRKRNGLTQDEFAERMTVTKTTVSNWECGVKKPHQKNKQRIVELFNLEETDVTFYCTSDRK